MEALKEVHTFEDGSMYMKKRRRDLPSKGRRDVHGINILEELQMKKIKMIQKNHLCFKAKNQKN